LSRWAFRSLTRRVSLTRHQRNGKSSDCCIVEACVFKNSSTTAKRSSSLKGVVMVLITKRFRHRDVMSRDRFFSKEGPNILLAVSTVLYPYFRRRSSK